ncbi:TATA-binding protein-associated factor BTAF1 [Forsythia ovata]|uniref:TATA-binding protein-associated factor BTAF1 n=1 Tax=Forsythia ovata TaxID=205694 RepID=A0ABD1U530_9LAMI
MSFVFAFLIETPTAIAPVELDPSSSSQSDSHEAATEVISARIKKLEKAIHRIVVCRSAPDWLPFSPRHSYWSLLPIAMESCATRKFSSARGWPSSTYFIEGSHPSKMPLYPSRGLCLGANSCGVKLVTFGGSLFEKLPKIWNCLAEFLKPCTIEGLNAEDEKLIDQAIESIRDPQILINNIQVVRSIAILLDETLRPKLLTLLPCIFRCVRHSHIAVRLSTSRCITAIAKSMALDVMGAVIENAVPMLGDMTYVHGRQGARCLLVCLCRDWDWNLSLMLLC